MEVFIFVAIILAILIEWREHTLKKQWRRSSIQQVQQRRPVRHHHTFNTPYTDAVRDQAKARQHAATIGRDEQFHATDNPNPDADNDYSGEGDPWQI